jgi:hypothetical protein
MRIAFHEDPIDIPELCSDLLDYGVAHFETSRPNFQALARAVRANGVNVMTSAAKTAEGYFYYFLLNVDIVEYQAGVTEMRVAQAITRWELAGAPVPHVETL